METKVAFKFDENDTGGVTIPPQDDSQNNDDTTVEETTTEVNIENQQTTDDDLGKEKEKIEEVEQQATTTNEPKEVKNDINDTSILAYFNKKNGTEFTSLEEYQKSLIPKADQTPIYDKETTAFLKYKEETGRSLNDWIKLSEDFNKLSDLELALDKIKQENEGLNLSDGDALLLLSDQLGFEFENTDDLNGTEKLKLSILANKHKKYLQDQQNLYKTPLENHTNNKDTPQSSDEKVFVGGQQVDLKVYQKQRKSYLENREKAVGMINKDAFTIEIDGKDGKSQLNFDYVFTDQDKQSMLSITESVDTIIPRFTNEHGELDHTAFNKAMWWAIPENRNKAMQSILHQARSNGIDEVLKKERNIDFNTKPLPNDESQKNSGYGQVGASKTNDGISVQYKFNE